MARIWWHNSWTLSKYQRRCTWVTQRVSGSKLTLKAPKTIWSTRRRDAIDWKGNNGTLLMNLQRWYLFAIRCLRFRWITRAHRKGMQSREAEWIHRVYNWTFMRNPCVWLRTFIPVVWNAQKQRWRRTREGNNNIFRKLITVIGEQHFLHTSRFITNVNNVWFLF